MGLPFRVIDKGKARQHHDQFNPPQKKRLSRASGPAGEVQKTSRIDWPDLRLPSLRPRHAQRSVELSLLHFLCSDKENEAKESLALRWACLVRQGGNLNLDQTIQLSFYISPAGSEALESLYFCGGLQR